MKYIEIVEGLSIRVDAIEAVEKKEDLTSIVRTQFNSYDSTFPYDVLLQLLEREEIPEEKRKQEEFNILRETGIFSP